MAEGKQIIHMDQDAFFVSVEVKKDSSLIGKPVIIGGSSDRGVVASCSYEARKFGVHSAMSSRMAKMLCPHAVFIRGNMDEYSKASHEITDILKEKVPLIEKASIDEHYIDMTGMDRFHGTEKYAHELGGKTKKALLWEVHAMLGAKAKPSAHAELFHLPAKHYSMLELADTPLENAYHELELLGFPLTLSMFDLLKTTYRGDVLTRDLKRYIGQVVRMVGQYVCEKTVHTKNSKKMWFGTFLDAEGDFFDTTHFPNSTPLYPFRGAGCYLIIGKVVEDFGFPSVEVIRFAKLEILGNPLMD